MPPGDFNIRATPAAAAFAPPAPAESPPVMPDPPPVVAQPRPRPRLGMTPHVEKLSQLKSQLAGLRDEMSSLDSAVKADKSRPQSGDTG